MRLAPTATRRRLADLGFFAAIVANFTLVLVGLAALRLVDEATSAEGNPFVLTRYQWTPQGEGMARMRSGFTLADARQLHERIGSSVRVGWLWRDETVAEVDGRSLALDVLSLSPEAFGLLLPPPRARCDPATLWLDARDVSALGSSTSLRVQGERLPVSAAELRSVRSLLAPRPQLLAVRCSDATPTAVQALIADGASLSEAALEAVAKDESLFRRALFQHELAYARLDSAVGSALQTQFGWARGALLASLLLALLLFLAWGVLRGLATRGELVQRRTLGARITTLGLRQASDSLRWMFGALVLAMLVFVLVRRAVPQFAELPLPGIAGVLLVLLLSLVASLLPQWLLALRNIDARLLHEVTGARRTVNLRPYLLLWSSGLGLALVFAVAAVGGLRNLWALANVDLGYQPQGLISVPVRLPSSDAGASPVTAMHARLLAATREQVAGAVSLICPPPWLFSGHPGALDNDAGIGLSMGAAPGVLTVLGVNNIQGRDLQPADSGQRVAITQGVEAERLVSLMRHERIGSIAGMKLGALAPHSRMLLISPSNPSNCPHLHLLIRDPLLDTRSLAALTTTLRTRFPTLAIGQPTEVAKQIAEARAPLTRLALLLAFAATLAAALQVVFTAALSMAYFDANRRELAVRMAFGLSSARAARAYVLRSLCWALPAMALAVYSVHLLQSAVAALLPAYTTLRTEQIAALCMSLLASVLLGNWLYALTRTAAVPLHRALASLD